jgi:hypothetical protein
MEKRRKLVFALIVLLAASLACTVRESPPVTDVIPLPPTSTSTPDYSSPCANVLFPFILERQWIYQKNTPADSVATPDPLTSKFGLTVVEVTESQATLNVVDLGTGVTTRTNVECKDGAIANFPLMTLGSLFGNYLVGDIAIVYVSGVFAPSITDLDASAWNMQWQGEYLASGTVTLADEQETVTIVLEESPVSMTWQTGGQESISVPAGTFEQAQRITRSTQVQATITTQGLTGQGILTIDTAHWFAPYVGLLKTEIISATLTTFGITFPIEITGSVELFETH